MQQTDLSLVGFYEVEFNDTDLRGANLSGANLRTADLANVIVDATTTFDQFTTFPDGFDPGTAGLTRTNPRLSDDWIKGLVGGFVMDGSMWNGIAYEAASNSLLLINYTDSVFRFSLTGELMESIQTPFSEIAGIEVLPSGHWLLASEAEARLAVYAPESAEIVSDAHVEFDEFEGIAYDLNRNTVFITEDDGFLKEIALDGTIMRCCFTTDEHENLGFDTQTNRLIALNYALDFLSEKGDVVNSVPIHERDRLGLQPNPGRTAQAWRWKNLTAIGEEHLGRTRR